MTFALSSITLIAFLIYIKKVCTKRFDYNKNESELKEIQRLWDLERKDLQLPKLRTIQLSELQFDKFVVIGEGFFGIVYMGIWNPDSDKRVAVAIKELTPRDGVYSEELNKNLIDEACIMCSLNNKNILSIIGICLYKSSYMLVTELMPFGDLRNYLVQNKHSIGSLQLLTWTLQIIDGMIYISGQNKFHGDLAARNIFVRKGSQVLIGDFGMAHIKSSPSTLAVAWAAPEVQDNGIFTAESDVWSLGVLLWEIFSFGENPYDYYIKIDNGIEKLFDRIEKGLRLNNDKQKWSLEVDEILLKCWVLPTNRISLSEMKEEFTKMLQNPGKFLFIPKHEVKDKAFAVLLENEANNEAKNDPNENDDAPIDENVNNDAQDEPERRYGFDFMTSFESKPSEPSILSMLKQLLFKRNPLRTNNMDNQFSINDHQNTTNSADIRVANNSRFYSGGLEQNRNKRYTKNPGTHNSSEKVVHTPDTQNVNPGYSNNLGTHNSSEQVALINRNIEEVVDDKDLEANIDLRRKITATNSVHSIATLARVRNAIERWDEVKE